MNSGFCGPAARSTSFSEFRLGDVDKRYVRPLRDEGLDHRRADAGAAAGDEDDAIVQAGIAGVRQTDGLPWRFGRGPNLAAPGAARQSPAGHGVWPLNSASRALSSVAGRGGQPEYGDRPG